MGGAAVIIFAASDYFVDAVHSAVPELTIYRGDVPAAPDFPYMLLESNFPVVTGRTVARTATHREFVARTTFAGLTARSVEIVMGKAAKALEGYRLDVAGWNFGALESRPNEQPIRVDRDVTIPDFGHPHYGVIDWVAVGSTTAQNN